MEQTKGLMSKEEIRSFQIKRNIVFLYKSFLILLEDLEQDQYIDEEKLNYLRKKVLDMGNDCIRNSNL